MGQHSTQKKSRRRRRPKKDPFLKLEVASFASLATLDRPPSRHSSGLLSREQTFMSCRPGTSNYLDRCNELTFTPETALLLPRPGTSYVPKAVESVLNESYCKELTDSQTRPSTSCFASKPQQAMMDPLEELRPTDVLVSQRKYNILPSIGNVSDIFLSRRQQRPFNQLDIDRGQFENDANFFAEVSSPDSTVKVTRMTPLPLPPIQRLDWDHCRQNALISECEEDDEYFESWSEKASVLSEDDDEYIDEEEESESEMDGSEYTASQCSSPTGLLYNEGLGLPAMEATESPVGSSQTPTPSKVTLGSTNTVTISQVDKSHHPTPVLTENA